MAGSTVNPEVARQIFTGPEILEPSAGSVIDTDVLAKAAVLRAFRGVAELRTTLVGVVAGERRGARGVLAVLTIVGQNLCAIGALPALAELAVVGSLVRLAES